MYAARAVHAAREINKRMIESNGCVDAEREFGKVYAMGFVVCELKRGLFLDERRVSVERSRIGFDRSMKERKNTKRLVSSRKESCGCYRETK